MRHLGELVTPLGQLSALASGARAHVVGVAASLRCLTKLDATIFALVDEV